MDPLVKPCSEYSEKQTEYFNDVNELAILRTPLKEKLEGAPADAIDFIT